MEEKEMREFSLLALLLVTGFCFLSFAMVLRILDGVNMKLFVRLGLIIFVSGLLTRVYILLKKKTKKRSKF